MPKSSTSFWGFAQGLRPKVNDQKRLPPYNTLAWVKVRRQNVSILQSPEFKSLDILGENGIIDLVNKFYNMVTANGIWLSTNEAWLTAQSNDESWLKILIK